MRFFSNRIPIAAIVLGTCLTTTAWAQSTGGGGGQLTSASDINAALRHAGEIAKDERVWQNLNQARALLESRGATVGEAGWQKAAELLKESAHTRIAADLESVGIELALALAMVRGQIIDALPPYGAVDSPNDDGGNLIVFWQPRLNAASFSIKRRDTRNKEWEDLKSGIAANMYAYKDDHLIRPWREYQYQIFAVGADGAERMIGETASVQARGNFINWNRAVFGILVVALCGTMMFYIRVARSGRDLKIRKIAGLEAVDDAVGRATEMGRPIMFIPGILDMNDMQTVAGLTILARVARVAADRDALLEVPTCRSLVMTAARETVHGAYLDAGRPDAYNEKKIYYTTDEQFGYVATVTGTMVREKPATVFYMGAFFAESLILAETANTTGSIQIAGTAMPSQLPFFVAACDYTLIGEEFFAASAYLSGEPQQMGALKGQDAGKLFGLVIIVVGALLLTIATTLEWEFGWVGSALDFITHSLLESKDQ